MESSWRIRAFHVALLVLGRLVVAVLGQVAQLAGALDGLRDLDAAARGEVLVLGLEPLVGAPGELVDIGHGRPRLPPGLTSIRRLAKLWGDGRPVASQVIIIT